jgi:hypothetical protein
MSKDSKVKKTVKTAKKTIKKPVKSAKPTKKPVKKPAVKKTAQKAIKPAVKKPEKKDVKKPEKPAAITPAPSIKKDTKPLISHIPEEQPVIPEKPDTADTPEQDLSLPEGSVYQQTGQRRPLIVFPK